MTSDPMFDPMFPNQHPFTPQYPSSPVCAYETYAGPCGCKESNEIHNVAVQFTNCVAYISDPEGARKIGVEVVNKPTNEHHVTEISRDIVTHSCGGTLEQRGTKLVCQQCDETIAIYL